MSPLTEPTSLTLRKSWQPMDADAAAYITAVETADGQALEEKTKIAIDNFVLGCKADGIWTAIKASCILAGARTLAGALVPLVGTAPTNPANVFVQADYNRKTGLVGDGSSKYIGTNRASNADPQNNFHMAVYRSTGGDANFRVFIGGGASVSNGSSFIGNSQGKNRNGAGANDGGVGGSLGFIGSSRNSSSAYTLRAASLNYSIGRGSTTPDSTEITVFQQNAQSNTFSSSRLAFYSIGESLDLAKLDARVTDLINAFGAAIP